MIYVHLIKLLDLVSLELAGGLAFGCNGIAATSRDMNKTHSDWKGLGLIMNICTQQLSSFDVLIVSEELRESDFVQKE